MITEIFYVDRDNTIDVQLRADGVAIEMDDVSKVELVMSDTLTISSDPEADPNVFDWDEHKAATEAADRRMIIALNEKSGDPVTEGTYNSYLTIYDPTNPNGIRWDDIKIVVK